MYTVIEKANKMKSIGTNEKCFAPSDTTLRMV